MASRRRDEHESSGFGRKLTTWVIVILITVWASRDPQQAAAVVHAIGTAIGNAASHYGNRSH
jgi:hypothetical protein